MLSGGNSSDELDDVVAPGHVAVPGKAPGSKSQPSLLEGTRAEAAVIWTRANFMGASCLTGAGAAAAGYL